MGYRQEQEMGMELLKVEKELMKKGFLVIGQHSDYHYFTCENQEGKQIYCQVGDFGHGYNISINYKPSTGHGSGIQYKKGLNLEDLTEEIEKAFNSPLMDLEMTRRGKPESIIKKMIQSLKRYKELGFREEEILKNIGSVVQNIEVPDNYYIFKIYDKKGNGFEAGKTIHNSYGRYSITN